MPVVFLLDNSLPMCQLANSKTTDEHFKKTHEDTLTKRDISHMIIQRLVEHLAKQDKYETFALVIIKISIILLITLRSVLGIMAKFS